MQARALHNSSLGLTETVSVTEQDCQDGKLNPVVKHAPAQCEAVQHAAEAVWSALVHKAIQREARSKRFDEVWPQILEGLILKGMSGVY